MTAHRLASGLALLAFVAADASAQAPRRDSLTLYEAPDYRGASVTFYGDNANIGSTGFTAKARSAQVIGAWIVCTGGGYRGRCERLDRNVRDLSAFGLAGQAGSALIDGPNASPSPAALPYPPPLQPYTAQPYSPGVDLSEPYGRRDDPARGEDPRPYETEAYPPATERRASGAFGAVSGLTATFFARPLIRDLDVSAARTDAADRFCRSLGMSYAAYFDRSRSAPRAIEPDGGVVGPGPVLSDVLCRRY